MTDSLRTILIATGNPSKVKEIRAVLEEGDSTVGARKLNWVSLADLGREIPEPVEDGQTLVENATLKGRYYSKASGLWALADDSGLEVDALGGEPGVNSAYYAKGSAALPRAERDRANNGKLIAALRGVPKEKRTARFRCSLILADGERIVATSDGAVEGLIIDEPRGGNGFGYDPHFYIPEMGMTTAELSAEEKNRVSHRGRALRVMRERLAKLF